MTSLAANQPAVNFQTALRLLPADPKAAAAAAEAQLGWCHPQSHQKTEVQPGLQATYHCWICRLAVCAPCFKTHLSRHGRKPSKNPT